MFTKFQKVEVDAKGSIYDRMTGWVVDVDDHGIVEMFFSPPHGPIGEATNLFTPDEVVPLGEGRPLSGWERFMRLINRLG